VYFMLYNFVLTACVINGGVMCLYAIVCFVLIIVI